MLSSSLISIADTSFELVKSTVNGGGSSIASEEELVGEIGEE